MLFFSKIAQYFYSCCCDNSCRTSVCSCCTSCIARLLMVPSLLGTYRYFKKVFSNFGVETTLVDMTDLAALEGGVQKNTKV